MSENRYSQVTAEISSALAKMRKEIPEVMRDFGHMSRTANEDGVLSHKEKELIAMGIAIAMRCQGCLGFHARTLVELGTTRAEFMELLEVAIYMGGGPSMMTAAEALMAYEEFGGEKGSND